MNPQFINDVIESVIEKIALRQGYVNNKVEKINSIPEENRMHHYVNNDNIPLFLKSKGVLKTPTQLNMENDNINLSTEGYGFERIKGNPDRGYVQDTRRILENSKVPDEHGRQMFSLSKLSDNAYDHREYSHVTDKEFWRRINKQSVRSELENYAGMPERGQAALNSNGASGMMINSYGKNSSDISMFGGLPNGKPNRYGSSGVIPTKYTGEIAGSEGLLLGKQLNILPSVHADNDTIELPTAKGVNFYNPKQMVARKDESGIPYSDVEGHNMAKQLKQSGAVPIQAILKRVKEGTK